MYFSHVLLFFKGKHDILLVKNYLGRWETLLNHVFFQFFSENWKEAEFTECTKVPRFFSCGRTKNGGGEIFFWFLRCFWGGCVKF